MATETQAQIDRINTEVATQASKIAQLSTILDGKAAGGGSGSVETCTVTVTIPDWAFANVYYINASLEPALLQTADEGVTEVLTVPKRSYIFFPAKTISVSGNGTAVANELAYVYGDTTIDV